MFKTIKAKFIVLSVLFIAISVGIPSMFLVIQFKNNFEQRSEYMLQTTLDVVRSCIRNSMMYGDKDLEEIVSRFTRHKNIKQLRILQKDGLILYSSDRTQVGKNIADVAPAHFRPNEDLNSRNIELFKGQKIYSALEPIRNEGACMNCHKNVETIAFLDIDTFLTKAETNFFTGSVHITYLAMAIILVLFLGFYFLFNIYINKPIKRFIASLDRVEKGDLTTRRSSKNDDEFGILDHHFNQMVSKLETSQNQINQMHFEQLQRADKLVTLGELAAEMAHEINNPAAVIMSRADYLKLESEDQPALRPYTEDLEAIINQTAKVSRITGNILKYSKKLPRDFRKIDLAAIVEESLNILLPRLEKMNIEIQKGYQCGQAYILGDAQQLEQVFTNLINNAIDVMEEGGLLSINLSCLDDGTIQFSISDSGNGIEEHTREQIFSPFFTTKPADKGTGLGLYIVKNICKNHSADISVESIPGQGTTFTIIFDEE